jgi:adenine-specific DNA-methyltransferase
MFQSSSKESTDNNHKLLEFKSLSKCSDRNLLGEVDLLRIAASLKQEQKQKAKLGQFLTPAPVAELMAGMFGKLDLPQISLLDAGAGIGSLLAAFVANLCHSQQRPANLDIVAYEIDPFLIGYLHQTLKLCVRECQIAGISLNYEIRDTDFIEDAVRLLQPSELFLIICLKKAIASLKVVVKAISDFLRHLENLSLNLSPKRRETLNFPPSRHVLGARGLG